MIYSLPPPLAWHEGMVIELEDPAGIAGTFWLESKGGWLCGGGVAPPTQEVIGGMSCPFVNFWWSVNFLGDPWAGAVVGVSWHLPSLPIHVKCTCISGVNTPAVDMIKWVLLETLHLMDVFHEEICAPPPILLGSHHNSRFALVRLLDQYWTKLIA